MNDSIEIAPSPCGGREVGFGSSPALPAIAALVLAGGDGRRMGGGKPQRALGARRLLDYAIDSARQHGGAVAVGVRHPEQADNNVDVIVDAVGVEGPLASLVAGLAWTERCGAHFLLTLPCDAPFLPCGLASRLHDRLCDSGAMVALPRSAGRLHPSCGLWRVEAARQAPIYIATGRASLQGFADQVGFVVEEWGTPERDPFFNINTPEDLRTAESWLAHPHFE